MNKNSLFDDVARSLASPIPRRRACAQILRGLGVAALASLGIPQTALAARCDKKKGETDCGTRCCKKEEQCCGKTCCGKSDKCCGNGCCGNGRVCCNGVCCKGDEDCVGNKCVKHQTKSKKNAGGR